MMWGRAADRPQMGCGRHARMAAGRATQEERHVRGARKKGRRLFLGKDQEMLSLPSGWRQQQERSYRGLGIQARRENGAQLRHRGGKNPACRGLRPVAAKPSLSSLQALDTYAWAQSGRNGWMSVFSSLCIYSISQNLAVVKNGKWKKMEEVEKSGRRGIAGDGD